MSGAQPHKCRSLPARSFKYQGLISRAITAGLRHQIFKSSIGDAERDDTNSLIFITPQIRVASIFTDYDGDDFMVASEIENAERRLGITLLR